MVKRLLTIPTVIYVSTLLALLVDTVGSNTTFYKYFHVQSYDVAFVSVGLLAVIRIFSNQKLEPVILKLNTKLLFPLAAILGIALFFVDYTTAVNVVYSVTRLQYIQLCLIGVFAGTVTLIHQSETWFAKNYPRMIFAGPVITYPIAFLVSLFPFDAFIYMSKEGGFIENVQVVSLVLAAIFCSLAIKFLLKSRERGHAMLFSCALVVLVFTIGEEVSWGQKVFNIQTPEYISAYNNQNELTVHNLEAFGNQKVNMAYILVGLYGAVAWVLQRKIPKLRHVPYVYYIPPWYTGSYFAVGFFFNMYTRLYKSHTVGIWSEFVEVMLYAGIMFTMMYVYLQLKHTRWQRLSSKKNITV